MDLAAAGTLVILTGALVLVLAVALSQSGSEGDDGHPRRGARGGGVVMIGPIPIIFGSDAKWASVAMVLAIVLVVLSLIFTIYGAL